MKHILLCEPVCHGFEHANFNASLLRMLRCGFPDAFIRFRGDATHLDAVQRMLRQTGADVDVRWETMRIPDRRIANCPRLPQEFRWAVPLLKETAREKPTLLFLTSLTNTGLLAVKCLMGVSRFSVPTVAMLHAWLADLLKPIPRRPWNWPICLCAVMRLPTPRALTLAALGEPIHDWLVKHRPGRERRHWGVINPPYAWPELPACRPPGPGEEVVFGYFGVTAEGFQGYMRLAEEMSREESRARFEIVGYTPGTWPGQYSSRRIRGLSIQPLPWLEFHRRASRLTYAVGTRRPEYYRLISSITFVDALAYLTPGIYLRNPFVEYFFERMGDIGYLCDSMDEMRELIRRLARDFPRERYLRQVETIRRERRRFDLSFVADQLKDIVGRCRTRLGLPATLWSGTPSCESD